MTALPTVKAPTDPIKAAKPCPICKEEFKSEWNAEDEEWIWLDAIKINDTVCSVYIIDGFKILTYLPQRFTILLVIPRR